MGKEKSVMPHVLKYANKEIAKTQWEDMKKKGYKPTKIQLRNGKYTFSIK